MTKPRADLKPNSFDYENQPLVTPNGFREYDARWLFGKELNLLGVQALGLGLGTYLHEVGVKPKVVTGHDFRSYSLSIKQGLILGLLRAGCEVHDIGLALSPEGEGNWAKSTFEDLVQYNDGFRTNLIGTPQQIAERIVALKAIGVDLVLTGFLHFIEEVEYFGKRVLPLVRELEAQQQAVAA